MRSRRKSALTVGGTAAAVVGAAVVARLFCPGGCQTCETCVSAAVPAGAGLLAVGTVVSTSLRKGRKSRSDVVDPDESADEDNDDVRDQTVNRT